MLSVRRFGSTKVERFTIPFSSAFISLLILPSKHFTVPSDRQYLCNASKSPLLLPSIGGIRLLLILLPGVERMENQ